MPVGDAELADLYRDVLLDYYRSPAHKGKLDSPDFRSHGLNPVCGDEVELTMALKGGKIGQIRHTGHGCVISQASTAMMAEALEGQSAERAKELIADFRGMLLENKALEQLPEELEEVKALEGVRKFPVRIKCALLAWNTMLLGLNSAGKPSEYKEIGA